MIDYKEMTKEQRKQYGFVTLSAQEIKLIGYKYSTKFGLFKSIN